jgi:hypothetical protein
MLIPPSVRKDDVEVSNFLPSFCQNELEVKKKPRVYYDTDINIYSYCLWPMVYYLPYGHTSFSLQNKQLPSNETAGNVERIPRICFDRQATRPETEKRKRLSDRILCTACENYIIDCYGIVNIFIR